MMQRLSPHGEAVWLREHYQECEQDDARVLLVIADYIEDLEKALRDIVQLATQRHDAPYGSVFWNMGDIEATAREALAEGT